MKKNINSFASNTEELTRNTNIALEALVGLNKSLTTQDDTISITVPDYDESSGNSTVNTFNIPSYTSIINKCNNTKNTVESLLSGHGNVKLSDGTYREIHTNTIAKTPKVVFDVKSPKMFRSVSNWFFEDLLYPKIVVPFNLKYRIDDESDRVVVKRVIVDNEYDNTIAWFNNNISELDLSYTEVIDKLTTNNIKYWEDEQIVDLPLRVNKFVGSFYINNTTIIDGNLWYILDNIMYSKNEEGNIVNNIELTVGDKLSFGESSFVITEMVNTENRISVRPLIGFDAPVPTASFEYYCEPFSEKIVEVAVGNNELIALFFKGVNDDYNMIGDVWSKAITFDTNNLVYEGTDMTMPEFYAKYVIDYGKQLTAQAKENFIPAYFGETPNVPLLNTQDFRVVQINKHINASISEQNILNTQRQIIETKSQIESYKSTIAKQKQDLISNTVDTERAAISESIRSYTNKLDTLSTEYSSMVKSLAALAYENDGVETKPKFRIRGFFPIPELKYTISGDFKRAQEIVQFEIAYRYLRMDNTSASLNTFTFTDKNGNQKTGVFTDWVYEKSISKNKVFDESTNDYVWIIENVSNGEEVNINQLDIPIQKGERVEIKVRSISEAGWPANPLKSDWSNPIIINFPSNISGTNIVSDIMAQAMVDENQIQLQETISAAGLYVHIDDSVQNSNVSNGVIYKHMSKNIGVDVKKDNNTTETVSLQSVIEDIISGSNQKIAVSVDNEIMYTSASKVLSAVIKKIGLTKSDISL